MLGPNAMQGGGGGEAREGELDKPGFPVSKSPPYGHLRLSNSPPPGHPLSVLTSCNNTKYGEFPTPWASISCLIPTPRASMVCLIPTPCLPSLPLGPNIDWCVTPGCSLVRWAAEIMVDWRIVGIGLYTIHVSTCEQLRKLALYNI